MGRGTHRRPTLLRLERLDDRPSGPAPDRADAYAVLMLAVIVLCLLTVPLAGGRLARLGELRLRAPGLAVAAIALQFLIVTIAPGGLAGLHELIHVASYALLGAFGWVNRRVAGVPVVLAGGALNALAILANGGVMPTDPDIAEASARQATGGEFANSTADTDARLAFLGDVFATPDSLPLQNVFSVGDVVIVVGLLVVVHAACHVQNAASSRARPTGSS
jgi:Family of unknown function (DUF5317)